MHLPIINQKISVSVVFVASLFMSIMDTTIVNVALPSLSRQFDAAGTSIDAIVVGYLVSLAIVIPASGWLGDRLGTKRVLLGALGLFTIASALCGLAPNLPTLIGFRVLQGLGGGALTPVGTAILYRTFPPIERVQVSRILTIPTVFAPALGPVIGGLLVDRLSWRWVFYVNVPIGIAVFVFGLLFLNEHRERTAKSFDLPGFLLGGLGLALTMYALSEGPNYGWTSASILSTLILGLVGLTTFVFVELRSTHPMLDLRLFSNRIFRTGNIVSFFSTGGFLALLFVFPLFLQQGLGVSAFVSGLTTFPEALGVLLGTQIATRLYPNVGPRRLIVGGLICVAAFMTVMSFTGQEANLWLLRALMFIIGAGQAFCFTSVQAAAFATVSSAQTGQGSAIFNAQRQVGASFGVALLGSILSIVGLTQVGAAGRIVPNLTAYHAAFFTSAVFAIIAAGIALMIRDSDAAATMRRKVQPSQQETVQDREPEQEKIPVALAQEEHLHSLPAIGD
jgi:EmrB/QacA subfamily drug resistance transporter